MSVSCNLPGPGCVGCRVKSLWQPATNLVGRDFCLRVQPRTPRILPRKVCIHSVDSEEFPIVPDMIVVSVRVQQDDRQLGQLGDNFLEVADSHAGVEQQSPLLADDQVADGLLGLVRFVDGENALNRLIDFEPWVADRDAFDSFVLRPRQRAAPVRDWSLSEQNWRLPY